MVCSQAVHPKVARGQMSTERSLAASTFAGKLRLLNNMAKQVRPLRDLLRRREQAREGGMDFWPARTPTLPGCTAPVVEVDYAPSLLWTAHAHPPPSLTPCPRLTPLQEAWSASASHFWTASLTTSPWSAWHLINVKHPLLQNPVTSLMPMVNG